MRVTHRTFVSFSIGSVYKDQLYYDIAPMDVGHIIFGRPWQYDMETTHDGKRNTYHFVFDNRTISLFPKEPSVAQPPVPAIPLFCSHVAFEEELRHTGYAFALLAVPTNTPPATMPYVSFDVLL